MDWDSAVLQIDWEHATEAEGVVPLKMLETSLGCLMLTGKSVESCHMEQAIYKVR